MRKTILRTSSAPRDDLIDKFEQLIKSKHFYQDLFKLGFQLTQARDASLSQD